MENSSRKGTRLNKYEESKAGWTTEERDRIVGFFALLLEADKKINPHLYTKETILELESFEDSESN